MENYIRIIVVLFVCWNTSLSAQDLYVSGLDWEEAPELHDLGEFSEEDNVIVLDKQVIEYSLNDDGFYMYQLIHEKRQLNSNEAIEEDNKRYVSMSGVVEVMEMKARIIKPNGEVVELEESDFQDAVDEEERQSYKYFAFEGLEAGSQIEYLYLLKKYPYSYRGRRAILQNDEPTIKMEYDLVSDTYLIFKWKSYNSAPEFIEDTLIEDKTRHYVELSNVPKFADEESSAPLAHAGQLLFKLDRNLLNNRSELSSYGPYADDLYKIIYAPLDKKAEKDLKGLAKTIGTSMARNDEEKVRKIEDYLKKNFVLVNANADQLEDVSEIIKSQIVNETGFLILFTNLFSLEGLEHQLVLTCDRTILPFDPDFECFTFLDETFIYLPELDLYMDPTNAGLRAGLIPAEYTHNNGLFIKQVKVGDYVTGLGKTGYIEHAPYKVTASDHFVKAKINSTMDNIEIELDNKISGYYAANIQPFYDLLKEDEQEDLNRGIVEYMVNDADEVKEISALNGSGDKMMIEPFIVHVEVSTTKFLEKAGDRYFFNIGELIGPQVEMYQEEERTMGIDDDNARSFYREIEVEFPNNYTVEGLEDLAVDVFHEIDGERSLSFKSTYSMEGNTLKVVIDEYYRDVQYPLELFEVYRSVVNAAADWNKKVLIMKPKS